MSSASRTATAAPDSELYRAGTDSERIALGLGGNLGDREANLRAALRDLSGFVELDAVSSVYETEPVGYRDQPLFWNLAATGRTALSPAGLLDRLLRIEARLGRLRTFRDAPRQLDIDVLLFGDRTLASDMLTVPHPRLAGRAFVLLPLAEIAPDLRLPRSERTIRDLSTAVAPSGGETVGVRKLDAPRFELDLPR